MPDSVNEVEEALPAVSTMKFCPLTLKDEPETAKPLVAVAFCREVVPTTARPPPAILIPLVKYEPPVTVKPVVVALPNEALPPKSVFQTVRYVVEALVNGGVAGNSGIGQIRC